MTQQMSTRDAVHGEAIVANIQRSQDAGDFPGWTDEMFQWFIGNLRKEWGLPADTRDAHLASNAGRTLYEGEI